MMINDEDLSGGLREEFTCQFCGKRFSVSKRFLDIAGDYIPQQCPECYDKEREQEKAAEMRKIREKLPDIYLASFNLGYDLKHASFENFQPQSERQMKAFEYAREFVSNDDYIVLFFGKTGNGKTHLAVSMLREWCSKDQPDCEYVTEKEIFDDLMTALSSKTTTMESVVKRYVNVEQLVIDEIGRAESRESACNRHTETGKEEEDSDHWQHDKRCDSELFFGCNHFQDAGWWKIFPVHGQGL